MLFAHGQSEYSLRGGRRRRRRYGPLIHSDVGRKLSPPPTSLSGVQGTACPQHLTLCLGLSEPKQCSYLREDCIIPDGVFKDNPS